MLQRSGRAVGFIEPCLPTSAAALPPCPEWLHEIKHDGFRILALRGAAASLPSVSKGRPLPRTRAANIAGRV